jgi:hypothetical protein
MLMAEAAQQQLLSNFRARASHERYEVLKPSPLAPMKHTFPAATLSLRF